KLVTVGIRLQSMFDSAWAQRMLTLLQARPDLHWVLVGLNSLPPALEHLKSQISLVPFQSNLGRVLKACDIYVNPDRLGGGLSVATAMACALPTLSLVDSDGGDKLGPFALATPEAYFDRLDALSQDLSQRLTLGNALRQRYLEELDIARAGPRLVQALDAAQAGFRARTSTPSS
ncbi:MAG TPA: glycosyltransferase, partial [Burkholderiaceae bacterium]|nr:glycosyltransferase [Burkholderiaceae bacterium]